LSDRERAKDPRTGVDAAAERIRQQSSWVDLQIRQAVARGDFEELPGYGKPLDNLTGEHDPDWWVKQLIEREQITGVLPPSLLVRKEDALLDDRLDALGTEEQVRAAVDEFNEQVRWALYRPPEGPPVITRQRNPDVEVDRWRERRTSKLAARRAQLDDSSAAPGAGRRIAPDGVKRLLRRVLGRRTL
jgi:hypothetical protein